MQHIDKGMLHSTKVTIKRNNNYVENADYLNTLSGASVKPEMISISSTN